MLPVVSVIMPVFNGGERLRATLLSVINQEGNGSLFEIQLIVVDDCSTDNSRNILEDMGISFLATGINTGGPNKGRNIGLKAATGDYICFIDQNDIWHPVKISKQLLVINEAPVVTTGQIIMNADCDQISFPDTYQDTFKCYKSGETFLALLSGAAQRQNSHPGTMMINASLRDNLFEEHFGLLDTDWLLAVFRNNPSIQLDYPMVIRMMNNNSLSLQADFIVKNYYFTLVTTRKYSYCFPRVCRRGTRNANIARALWHFSINDMRRGRKYLLKARPGLRTLFYLIMSFTPKKWVLTEKQTH